MRNKAKCQTLKTFSFGIDDFSKDIEVKVFWSRFLAMCTLLTQYKATAKLKKKSTESFPSWHFRITFVGCQPWHTKSNTFRRVTVCVQNFFLSFSVSLRPNSFFKPFGRKSEEQASSDLHHGRICQVDSKISTILPYFWRLILLHILFC